MRERFCLNTATIKPTSLDLQLKLARENGFRLIGLWLKDVEDAVAKGTSLDAIKAQLDAFGLAVAEMCFVGGWQDADDAQFAGVLAQTHHISEVSSRLGCDIVVTVPSLKAGGLNTAPERFRRVCEVAAEHGVRIALEFPGIAAEVKDLRTARDLVAAAHCPNGGLVIDTFHFFVGHSDPADFARMSPEELFLVHVSDALNLPAEKLRIPHDNRTYPGAGILDFGPVFEQLAQWGYSGAISLEIWNRELHQQDPAEVVKKGWESLLRLESRFNHSSTRSQEA